MPLFISLAHLCHDDLQDLFQGIPESMFRTDISSTQLRQEGRGV